MSARRLSRRALARMLAAPLILPIVAGAALAQPVPAARSAHELAVPGGTIAYDTEFAQHVLAGPDGQPAATISTIAYLRRGGGDPGDTRGTARPVLFAFNGGPGASSSPLHVQAMGPRLRADGAAGGFVDNPLTPLDRMDLVFVDPVGTGFSRPLRPDGGAPFWSVEGDARAMAEAITAWLAAHGRQDAPVLIAGESYGGTRLAAMLPALRGVRLAGLLFISPALTIGPQGDAEFIAALPAMAVAAAAHGKGALAGQDPARVEARARAFATQDYALALQAGSALPAAREARVAARLSGLIGMPAATIRAAHLRIDVETFRATLLAAQGLVVGRLDSRVTAPRPVEAPGRPSAASDPALGLGRSNVIVSAPLGAYLRDELGVRTGEDYRALTLDVNFAWQWPRVEGREQGPDLLGNVRAAMADHPGLRVTMVGGLYDMAVPLAAVRTAIDHAWLPPARVSLVALAAGHSAFEGEAGRRALRPVLEGLLAR